jgi:hypothetical protein
MRGIALLMALLVLGGCGANVTMFGHTVSEGKSHQKEPVAPVESTGASTAAVAAPAGAVQTAPVVRDVLLSLSATVKQQLAGDTHFDAEALHASVAAELRSRGLMGPPESTSGTPIDILIDTYSLQATTNAALFGRVASAGKLAGLVRVLDDSGKEQRSFKVQGEAKLQIATTGKDPEALSALYKDLARKVADGIAAK